MPEPNYQGRITKAQLVQTAIDTAKEASKNGCRPLSQNAKPTTPEMVVAEPSPPPLPPRNQTVTAPSPIDEIEMVLKALKRSNIRQSQLIKNRMVNLIRPIIQSKSELHVILPMLRSSLDIKEKDEGKPNTEISGDFGKESNFPEFTVADCVNTKVKDDKILYPGKPLEYIHSDNNTSLGVYTAHHRGCLQVDNNIDDCTPNYLIQYMFFRDSEVLDVAVTRLNDYMAISKGIESIRHSQGMNYAENSPLLPVSFARQCSSAEFGPSWLWFGGIPIEFTAQYVLTIATQPLQAQDDENYYTLEHFIHDILKAWMPKTSDALAFLNEILTVIELMLCDMGLSTVDYFPNFEITDVLIVTKKDHKHVKVFFMPKDYTMAIGETLTRTTQDVGAPTESDINRWISTTFTLIQQTAHTVYASP